MTRTFLSTVLLLLSPAWAGDLAPLAPLAPWAARSHPTDAAKRHVQEIASARAEYTLNHGGSMDGQNCASPVGVYEAWKQTWESNRSVRIENIGVTDVQNPWLSNGRNQFRTLEEIVASALEPGMSDKEKAIALWRQQIAHRYHWGFDDNVEAGNPVKVLNIYGFNTCGNDSLCLAGLWRRAGLKVAPARLVGHCISQVFYDGGWHLLDGDQHEVFLLRDNQTVAGEQDLVRDHDLIKRSHTHGLLTADRRAADEADAALYICENPVTGDRNCYADHSMNMVLRPGEALTWRWGHLTPVKYHGKPVPQFPDTICNGLWEYRPDLTGELWRKGAGRVENIRLSDGRLTAEPNVDGVIEWTLRSPYIFVGGHIEAEGKDVRFALSWDGKTWQDAAENLDTFFPPEGPPRYAYHLRCQLPGGAWLKSVAIVNDLQMAPLALPGAVVGPNKFVYTDASAGERKVRVTHDWVERSAARPPDAPPDPVAPANGGESSGTDIVFQWTPPANTGGGGKVADYHFELSDRADLKWPLSTNFAKLISNTADRGKPQYSLPYAGLLEPDRKYYWRVRAKNEQGVWGPWSQIWSFTPHGAAPPLDAAVAFDAERGVGTLRWKPNPAGRRPAAYRVYASDERGFSVSDTPYDVYTGKQKDKLASSFPANFVAETADTQLAVLGTTVNLANGNKAFYRIVAVDEQGKRSGPSDYAAAPRPLIHSAPVVKAKAGTAYRYQLATIRSLGDLRAGAGEAANFWDVEKPKYSIEQGPAWLKLDAATGLLTGTPDAPGKAEVTVSAIIERQIQRLDEKALSWGTYKSLGTATEKVGSATQKFVIEIGE